MGMMRRQHAKKGRPRLSFEFTKNQLIEKLRRLKKKYRVCATRMAAQGWAFAFKSAHEGSIYDLAHHIWPPALKRDGLLRRRRLGRGHHQPRRRSCHRGSLCHDDARCDGGWFWRKRACARVHAHGEWQGRAARPAENGARAGGPGISFHACTEFNRWSSSGADWSRNGLKHGIWGSGCADTAGLSFGIAGVNPGVPSVDKWRQQQILELEVCLKRIELVLCASKSLPHYKSSGHQKMIERINWMADQSEKGVQQSGGIMVREYRRVCTVVLGYRSRSYFI
ncbi:hypothetical protein E2562_016293 [Oryza meyeriana var. granulata]|uniref:Glabrous enhancer-binding protein-like DBD domain-containing protein n=1 Tax=Oryza meyeriana var. granulata TaxID=110450 RepID=A0A6G1CQU5_9ORYZ|nr:hypothetical protein E2562_016293 [Oryza meyeriana var. granulata]